MLEELLNSDKVEAQLTQLWQQGKQDEALALIHDYTSRLDTVADYCGEQGQYEQWAGTIEHRHWISFT